MFNWHTKSSEITPKRLEVYKRLGLEPPEPPQFDSDIQSIIETYHLAARGRGYIDGQPLRLNVRNITDVVEAHPVAIPRSILDGVIFAIDDIVMDEQRKSSDK